MLKIYLAGPDVFEVNAVEEGEKLKALCAKYGFIGLFPLDNEIVCEGSAYEMAKMIREANIKLIEEADIILANLDPFRGLEPDSGTVYEVGYAQALGKEVYAYAGDRREMIVRIREAQLLSEESEHCRAGKVMEDFGLSHNLMMLDIVIATEAEEALEYLSVLQREGK